MANLVKKKSIGNQVEITEYIGFKALEMIEEDFSICHNPQSLKLLGNDSLRKKISNVFFPSNNNNNNNKQNNRGKKRKRQDLNDSTDREMIKKHRFPIPGLGMNTPVGHKCTLREIRTKSVGNNLDYRYKIATISYFSLFNSKFQKKLSSIQDIVQIECKLIDRSFNQKYGFHGVPGKGVAFLFHMVLNDGSNCTEHYCLGNTTRECSYGCCIDDFSC